MRTNIVLDDELITKAQVLTGLKTKREIVNEALIAFVQLKEQAKIKSLRGKLKWEGDLNEQRLNRSHDIG